MWQWHHPTKIIFGEGVLERLPELVEGRKRILVITGKKFARESGIIGKVETFLKGKEWHWYYEVLPEPTWDVIQKAVDFSREYKPDCIIGIGGGSVLDTAKLCATFINNPGSVRDFIGKRVVFSNPKVFSIMVPTTAGSGSEVTQYCVVMDRERRIKSPVTSFLNFPDVALDDPAITYRTPYEIARNAGIDALSHCLEAFLSKNASPVTEIFSIEGISLIFRYLKNALNDEKIARHKVMLASLYGGLSISGAGAGLIHQLGHALTVLRGYSHGYTMGIFMVPVLEFYGDNIEDKLRILEMRLGVKHFIGFLHRFVRELGIPEVGELDFSDKEIVTMVDIVFKRKHIFDILPKKFSRQELIDFLKGIG